MSGRVMLNIAENDVEAGRGACAFVVEQANKAISDRGIFTIGLSGGSAAKYLCEGLPQLKTDWSKWRIFFCDERHVPFDNEDCTYKIYKDNLMSKVPIAQEYVFADNPDIPVEEAATLYKSKLQSVFGDAVVPEFDVLVLGMGPDGHTCSLFPGHKLLQETEAWVASISDSPKPPPQRITFTFPVINNCCSAVFIACGSGKAEMVQRVIQGTDDPPLPASRVKPHSGMVYWFLDKSAASLLSPAQI